MSKHQNSPMLGWLRIFMIRTSLKSWDTKTQLVWCGQFWFWLDQDWTSSHLLQAGGVQLGLIDDLDGHLSETHERVSTCGRRRPCFPAAPLSASHLSSRRDVPSQLHFGEVSLPDGFHQPVVPHVRRIVAGGRRGVFTASRADGAGHFAMFVVSRGMLGKQKHKDVPEGNDSLNKSEQDERVSVSSV